MSSALRPMRWIVLVLIVSSTTWKTSAEDFPFADSAPFEVNTATPRIDSDADGMPDAYERAVGLNAEVNDAGEDPDGDGSTNIQEYNAGTPPFAYTPSEFAHAESLVFTVTTRTNIVDSDGDRLPDWWELQNGLSITQNNADEDPDNDGLTNLEEFNNGTNPQSSDSPVWSISSSGLFSLNTGPYSFPISRDTDGDGMPDWWEQKYHLNPQADDASVDADGDGVPNLTEFQQGRNPSFNESIIEVAALSALFNLDTVGAPPDTDHDGMRDYWEIAHGLNPFQDDANQDADGDGRTNLEEYNAGTDPQIDDWRGPSSVVSLVFTVDTGGFRGPYTRDTDGDGMPDWWEIRYGLAMTIDDAMADADGDGVSNLEEYRAGSNPSVFDRSTGIDGVSAIFLVDTGGRSFDSDHDGLPDWWERLYFGDSRVASPSADTDGDGQSNYAEFLAGSSPIDAQSLFRIQGFEIVRTASSTNVTIRWASFEGNTYSIWSATAAEGPYSVIAANIVATPPMNSAIMIVASEKDFFRISSVR